MLSHSDIIVAGGGPVGAAFALAVADSDFSVQLLEARPYPSAQASQRTLALSYGTRLILDRLNVWPMLHDVTPIRDIHISQRGSLGTTRLHASEEQVPELGYVVEYSELDAALHAALAASSVHTHYGTKVTASGGNRHMAWLDWAADGAADSAHGMSTTRLAVIADGGHHLDDSSSVAQKSYAQHALLAWVKSERSHRNEAFERFTPEGPMALLPHGEGFALVLTAAPDKVQHWLALSDAEFLAALHEHFGDRVGAFLTVRNRSSFPLQYRLTRHSAAQHRVLIGNAAHVMHPVAGQGFNLGLRDAWELAQQVHACSHREELGDANMLAHYQRARRLDVSASMLFTDQLVRWFTLADPVLRHARSFGLSTLQQWPPLRHFVARRMMFGAQAW